MGVRAVTLSPLAQGPAAVVRVYYRASPPPATAAVAIEGQAYGHPQDGNEDGSESPEASGDVVIHGYWN